MTTRKRAMSRPVDGLVRQCVELVDKHPGRLGRYICNGLRPCKHKATVQTKRGWMCKRHARAWMPNATPRLRGGAPTEPRNGGGACSA